MRMIWTSLIAQSRRRLWMSLFVAILIALVYFHFARFYQGTASSWLFTIGWVPVALNVLRAGLGLAYRLDRQPFCRLDLGIENDQVAPGRTFEIEIQAEARRPGVLRKLSVGLRCVQQRATDRARERTELLREERVLEENLVLNEGLVRSYRVSFPLPADAPYSFRSMEGKIAWTVEVAVDMDEWGELRDELEVTVAPG